MTIKALRPFLEVENLTRTLKFYNDKLGFKCIRQMGNEWATVTRDGIFIMFANRFSLRQYPKPVFTGSLYFYTDEVDIWWNELKEKATISYPIETFNYGMREFGLIDCNGYLLQFGQEIG